jgi:hypothetical protein
MIGLPYQDMVMILYAANYMPFKRSDKEYAQIKRHKLPVLCAIMGKAGLLDVWYPGTQ